jgi:hypothetical protein
MIVAGQLLATRQVGKSSYEDRDEFHNWLERHTLTRADGYWLSDRRDPHPLERPAWKDDKDDELWEWSLKKGDFDVVLKPTEGIYSLWGYWANVDDRREEHIHVSSALVSAERAPALLRALQSTRNPHDYRIPPAGDELEIDHGLFQLKGWIESHTRDRELDGFDPWAGAISYPPPRPAQNAIDLLNLKPDIQGRQWHIGGNGATAVSATWGQVKEKRRGSEEDEVERGTRLQAPSEFVGELLKKTGMQMIVKVEINRKHTRRSYDHSSRETGFEYPLYSARLFLIDGDGRYVSI